MSDLHRNYSYCYLGLQERARPAPCSARLPRENSWVSDLGAEAERGAALSGFGWQCCVVVMA